MWSQERDEKLFLAHSVWQMEHLAKFSTFKVVGETERSQRQIFHRTMYVWVLATFLCFRMFVKAKT